MLPNRSLPKYEGILGTQAAQPASGSVEMRVGFNRATGVFRLDFTLRAARITVTDAAGSGSSGSLPLFTFIKGVIANLQSRQNYTAFVEGSALTTGAGDAVHLLAVGSAAADAGDGALSGTEVDIAPATAQITNSGGTGTGSKIGALGSTAGLDGTSTAITARLNWSGTAATIDANSTIDVTGTITITGQLINPTETV